MLFFGKLFLPNKLFVEPFVQVDQSTSQRPPDILKQHFVRKEEEKEHHSSKVDLMPPSNARRTFRSLGLLLFGLGVCCLFSFNVCADLTVFCFYYASIYPLYV